MNKLSGNSLFVLVNSIRAALLGDQNRMQERHPNNWGGYVPSGNTANKRTKIRRAHKAKAQLKITKHQKAARKRKNRRK